MTDDRQTNNGPDAGRAEPQRCTAVTAKGTRCKNRALPGGRHCAIHRRVLAAAPAGVSEPPAAETPLEELGEEQLRVRLREEVNRLLEALQELDPDFRPRAFSPASLVEFMRESLAHLRSREAPAILDRLRQSLEGDLFDPDMWKGVWYMLQYTAQYQADMAKRRLTGDYYVDPYGMDAEFRAAVRPFFLFLYRYWWRVEAIGVENVPADGRALLVANHSGVLPWDGTMIAAAVELEHPGARTVRPLILDWFPSLPFASVLLEKMGGVLGTPENGERLLEEDELVLVFPEGVAGVGKLFRDRYRLARFGRGGFARSALRAGAPIIPVAVVGAEEIYPMVARSRLMARLLRFPYFPITPFWPWLGPLGTIPLPTRWSITFGEPIETASFGPAAADNLTVVAELSDLVRNRIQALLVDRLRSRRSLFLG